MYQALMNPQTLGMLSTLIGNQSVGQQNPGPEIYDSMPVQQAPLPTGATNPTLGQLIGLINNPRGMTQIKGV